MFSVGDTVTYKKLRRYCRIKKYRCLLILKNHDGHIPINLEDDFCNVYRYKVKYMYLNQVLVELVHRLKAQK